MRHVYDDGFRELWKEKKWFRWMIYWNIVCFLAISFLIRVFFHIPFWPPKFFWQTVAKEDFGIWITLGLIWLAGTVFCGFQFFQKLMPKRISFRKERKQR